MSIDVKWLSPESNIIRLTIDQRWSWSDFFSARQQMYDLMDKSDHQDIDYILDMRNAPTLPENVLSQMRNLGQKHHPKSRHMIVVGANRFIKTMFDIMQTLTPSRMEHITLVQTLEDAEATLKRKYQIYE